MSADGDDQAQAGNTRQEGLSGSQGAIAFAQSRPEDRGDLRQNLLALGHDISRAAQEQLGEDPRKSYSLARRYAIVYETLDAIEKNGQPALALEAMITRFRNV